MAYYPYMVSGGSRTLGLTCTYSRPLLLVSHGTFTWLMDCTINALRQGFISYALCLQFFQTNPARSCKWFRPTLLLKSSQNNNNLPLKKCNLFNLKQTTALVAYFQVVFHGNSLEESKHSLHAIIWPSHILFHCPCSHHTCHNTTTTKTPLTTYKTNLSV